MADQFEEDDLEEDSDEVDLPLEDVVTGLHFRVLELERQMQALTDVVKPYKHRWWRDWSWQDAFGVAAVFLGPLAFAWILSSQPQLALPALIGMTIVGVAGLGWVLYLVVAGLLSKKRERRRHAIDLFATMILALGLNGLIPVSSVSPTWQMPLWLALLLIGIGSFSFFRFPKKR